MNHTRFKDPVKFVQSLFETSTNSFKRKDTFTIPPRVAYGLYKHWPTPLASECGLFGDVADSENSKKALQIALQYKRTKELDGYYKDALSNSTRSEFLHRFNQAIKMSLSHRRESPSDLKEDTQILSANTSEILTEWPLDPVVWYVRESLKDRYLDPQLALFLYNNIRHTYQTLEKEKNRLFELWNRFVHIPSISTDEQFAVRRIQPPNIQIVKKAIEDALRLQSQKRWPPSTDRMKFRYLLQHIWRREGRTSNVDPNITRLLWKWFSGESIEI